MPQEPTKLTDKTIEQICRGIEKGMFIASAVRLGGISESTWHLWKQKARAGAEPYADYLQRITIAETKANEFYVSRLYASAKKDWRAALAVLERRFRNDWAPNAPPPAEESEQLDLSGLTDEEMDTFHKLFLKAKSHGGG